MGASLKFVDDPEESVRELYRAMEAGACRSENRDLPFMGIVDRYDTDKLRSRHQINETLGQGPDVADSP